MMDLLDHSYQPTLDEIGEYIGNPVFGKFCSEIGDKYKGKEKIEFSSCSWERGWNVKFKKSGKSLCTVYPRESYFTVLVVIGQKEKEAVESMLPGLSPELQNIYRQTREGNGQKWLMIDLEDQDSIYRDTLRLIEVRGGQKKENEHTEFTDYFPVWGQLTPAQQDKISGSIVSRTMKKGTVIHNGSMDCAGLLLVQSGQLRAYILSDEGREITIYRLFDRDLCLFSASCMMRSIQFEITIQAEKDSSLWIIPTEIYQKIMKESAPLSNYTNEIMASRFSEVMWLVEQIMWKSLDKRISSFLLEESAIENSDRLKITHETIAGHLGTHREVVTRMLHYFQNEGMIALSRGTVEIINRKKLEAFCKE